MRHDPRAAELLFHLSQESLKGKCKTAGWSHIYSKSNVLPWYMYIYIYVNGYQWYLAEILRGTVLSLLPMDQSSYRNTGVPTYITLHNVSEFQHPASSMSVYFQKTHCIFVVALTLRCHQTWLPAKSPNSMEVYATIMELNDGLHIYASMDLDKTNKYQSVCKKTNFRILPYNNLPWFMVIS